MTDDLDEWPEPPPPPTVDIGQGRRMWISKRPDLYPGGHIAVDMPDGSTRWFSSVRLARSDTLAAPVRDPGQDNRRGIRSPRVAAALAELGHSPARGRLSRVARQFGMSPANLHSAWKRHSASGAI